jgi:hypothetical protein
VFKKLLLLMMLGIALGGCTPSRITRGELVGKYKLDLPGGGVENLQLKSDGSCVQEIQLQGKTLVATGSWKFYQKEQAIVMHGIRNSLLFNGKLDPNVFGPPLDRNYAPSVVRPFGHVKITGVEGAYYNKVE